ncbi:hypothetical protein DFQ27_007269 [Actinomortierella ambigua]|uniref:Prolyl 4-hydroxylase alpha subunit domain-containing protein n=1 Tax=Actinomortierella ambigua TaxID=1343610 RepID=A0A9P6PW07_9FUNG|nr:hypothetical protein DFQ27_007269 [Actinomortierella ambigua]
MAAISNSPSSLARGLGRFDAKALAPPEVLPLAELLPRRAQLGPILAFTLQQVFTEKECLALIQASENQGYVPAKVNMGSHEELIPEYRKSLRCIIDDHEFARKVFERVAPFVPATYANRPVVGINERFRFLKYLPGDCFMPHYDGEYRRPDGSGEVSKVTIQIYLNGDCIGGETSFLEEKMGGSTQPVKAVRVNPTTGQVLIFEHPLLHEGSPVIDGVKYAIRSDIMYGPPAPHPKLHQK